MDWAIAQLYSGAPVGSKGFNFIALSTDATGGTGASTTLTSEIVGSGLTRAAATYSHTAGTAVCTLVHAFTYAGAGSAQLRSAALFTDASGGTMNHLVAYTLLSLPNGQTVTVTVTITGS
jgi:hypothetical protein